MIVEEIFEGLKLAISEGETLQQSMQSFYNAGYKKEDIESAARLLGASAIQSAQPQEIKIPQKQPIIPKQIPFKPIQRVSSYGQPPIQQQPPQPPQPPQPQLQPPIQRVSSYGQPPIQQQPPQPPQPQLQPPIQRVSSYGQPPQQTNPKLIMIILVILLLIVFGGAIGGILFFRETVIDFFNSFIV